MSKNNILLTKFFLVMALTSVEGLDYMLVDIGYGRCFWVEVKANAGHGRNYECICESSKSSLNSSNIWKEDGR